MKKVKSFILYIVNLLPVALSVLVISALLVICGYGLFTLGYVKGFETASTKWQEEIQRVLAHIPEVTSIEESPKNVAPTPIVIVQTPSPQKASFSGPELWDAVNKRRKELGVNELSNQSELCTIASIRLNELLELGKLDGHEGFSNLAQRRDDLKWIFEKYNISEFLVSGVTTPTQAEDAL